MALPWATAFQAIIDVVVNIVSDDSDGGSWGHSLNFCILLYFTLLFLDRGNRLWLRPYVHREEFCLLLLLV